MDLSNGNKEELHIPQWFRREALLSNGLISYPKPRLGGGFYLIAVGVFRNPSSEDNLSKESSELIRLNRMMSWNLTDIDLKQNANNGNRTLNFFFFFIIEN